MAFRCAQRRITLQGNYTHTHDYSTAILSIMSSNLLVNMSICSELITKVIPVNNSSWKEEALAVNGSSTWMDKVVRVVVLS